MTRSAIPSTVPPGTPRGVRATVDIAAPPERVFEALTDPAALAAWWGSDDSYRTHDWQVDPRPGGPWSARTTAPDGSEATVRGEYRVVDPPAALEYTWEASWDGFVPTVVRCRLVAIELDGGPGTRLTVTHVPGGVTACASLGASLGAAHAAGWPRLLVWLERSTGSVRLPVGAW